MEGWLKNRVRRKPLKNITMIIILLLLVSFNCTGVYVRSPVTFENEIDILNKLHHETMETEREIREENKQKGIEQDVICIIAVGKFILPPVRITPSECKIYGEILKAYHMYLKNNKMLVDDML